MTNEEILKKVIEKAVGNGYKEGKSYLDWIGDYPGNSCYEIIFSHEFAKAFWNFNCKDCINYKSDCQCSCLHEEDFWQYHLQRMVLETEPLKYLEKFL